MNWRIDSSDHVNSAEPMDHIDWLVVNMYPAIGPLNLLAAEGKAQGLVTLFNRRLNITPTFGFDINPMELNGNRRVRPGPHGRATVRTFTTRTP